MKRQTRDDYPMVGRHPALLEVLQLARRVAQSNLPTNIWGETGTGKELLAKFIHAESRRRKGPFVTVDCGILAPDMARSELFGHVRGAFTGASETRLGLVEAADRGTLFLDEVGELSDALQLQLLRLVQDGAFRRVGESAMRTVDVRIITATHRDLRALVRQKRFREDLYFRLHVVPLRLPPLRERLSDVPLLVDHFSAQYGSKASIRRFTHAAKMAMRHYAWPGNIRELDHEVARLMVTTLGPVVDREHLPARMQESAPVSDVFDMPFKEARVEIQKQFTREYLQRALRQSNGNVSVAARASGIGRQYFQLRMAETGVRAEVYRRKKEKRDREGEQ